MGMKIPHELIGFGKHGWRTLRDYLRKTLNGGNGYVHRKKDKIKALGETWRLLEERADAERGITFEDPNRVIKDDKSIADRRAELEKEMDRMQKKVRNGKDLKPEEMHRMQK